MENPAEKWLKTVLTRSKQFGIGALWTQIEKPVTERVFTYKFLCRSFTIKFAALGMSREKAN